MNSLYSRRRRARRLNDPNKTVEKETEDEVDPDDLDLDLDYGGVVERANDEEEKRDRREEFAKSVGSSGDGISFEEVWKGDREEDPGIDYSYDGITKSAEETEREKDAAAIGEAVADELAARGLAGDDEDGDGHVRKDADADAWDDLSTEVEELADKVQKFVEDRREAV
ncbi:hypothetical protein BRD20_09305 [Halobacteriales archaeon SW_8_65_20]|nr:MAG: hypothetical protein BRD20_09305 [Halobacteriales archaeon SW_8_65_20]